MRKQSVRIDDSAVVDELVCQRERANWVAKRFGLPTVGAKLVNFHGIEWVVQSHAAVPTYDSLHRLREGDVNPELDLYPVIAPANLSPKLMEFFSTIDRCTTKTFAMVDTMPGRRPDGHIPGGNHIDTVCHPVTNVIFLDALRVSETVIAHEFGHAWVQYVDGCEDFRTMEDAADPQRMRHVGFVQSFVLDLKVNDLLRRKEFDMAPIEEDQACSLQHLAEAFERGYAPKHPLEEVFMALLIADQVVGRGEDRLNDLVRFEKSFELIRAKGSALVSLAETFAHSVARHGYSSRAAIAACIDECLVASFEYCGDRIDLDQELVLLNSEEPNFDKFPDWLPALTPRTKCQVGKHMARNDISSGWSQRLEPTITGRAKVSFMSPERDQASQVILDEHVGPPTRYSDLPEMVAELLALKHLNEAGGHQLRGGAPFTASDLHHKPGPRTLSSGQVGADPDWTAPSLPAPPPYWPPRHYMAGYGRFLTQTALEMQTEGEHPYGYALNNPVTYTDPSGMQVPAPPTQYPFPPPWFPPTPAPIPPVAPPTVPVGPICIIICGVEACHELCTYTPGHPTGLFTGFGQCIGNRLFPYPIGEPPKYHPKPIRDPIRRLCRELQDHCNDVPEPPIGYSCWECFQRCVHNGGHWPHDRNCDFWNR